MAFVSFRHLQGRVLAEPDPATPVLRAAEVAALRDALGLVAAAQAEAERKRADARAAYDAECRRGYEDGLAQARLEQAERIIENVGRTVDYMGRIEGEMVDLVMAAVQKIVLDFKDEDRVLAVVRSALSAVRNQKQVTLRIAPPHVETVKGRVNEVLAAYPGVSYLDIVADARLSGDACLLESDIGSVEASIEGQLTALRAAFHRVLGPRA